MTDAFREQLLATDDDARRRELVCERRQLVDRCSVKWPLSHEREASDEGTDERVIAAIRGRRPPLLARAA